MKDYAKLGFLKQFFNKPFFFSKPEKKKERKKKTFLAI